VKGAKVRRDSIADMKRFLLLVLFAPGLLLAATEARLDHAPIDIGDAASIQRGAKVFVNYCLNCHSAQYMRYNRLTDVGLSEQQIRDNLMFMGEKAGEPMTIPTRKADQAQWFGAAPPDLSVIARSRGPDWLYTYLRSYYRDPATVTGWNNVVFPNVGMPHVLWELQGQQVVKAAEKKDGEHGAEHGNAHAAPTLELAVPGTLSPREYDKLVADLVNYLVFMGEPVRAQRAQLGNAVLIGLGVLFVLAYLLKKEFWKDVH
jgi:ubiquinol-cytochrome c reductase cytochrome c1 subunit